MDFSLLYKQQRNSWFHSNSFNNTHLHTFIETIRKKELHKISQEKYSRIRKLLRMLQTYYTIKQPSLSLHPLHTQSTHAVSIHFNCQFEKKHSLQATHIPDAESLLQNILTELIPWRKGPFTFNATHIDTEWNSFTKWSRIASNFSLEYLCKGKDIIDIGANNMYYDFLMIHNGAKKVLAIEPLEQYRLFHELYMTLLSCDPAYPLYFEMLGIEEVQQLPKFDTAFLMGILYHRRDPLGTLEQLHTVLRKGGLAVIETMCIPIQQDYCLVPHPTYQKSKGYWFLPSLSVLQHWITRSKFEILYSGNMVATQQNEQKKSIWIRGESLEHFLDPNDNTKTIEGYPAPHRVLIIARAL